MALLGAHCCFEEGGRRGFRWIKEVPAWRNPDVKVEGVPDVDLDGADVVGKLGVRVVVCDQQAQAEREARKWHPRLL